MLQETIHLIVSILLTAMGLLLIAKTTRAAWARRRPRRDGTAPVSRPIGLRSGWKNLVLGIMIVLLGVSYGLELVPAFTDWANLLSIPSFVLAMVLFVVWSLKDTSAR